MLLYHLKISHFRGIKSLDWYPNGRLLCLIGPNDATKTTILEAIQLVSLPRYNAAFTEIDFHKGDTATKIVIEATFGDLPDSLLDELSKFGLLLRGYDTTNKALAAAPVDGLQKALTVRFELDASLEPTWAVVNEGDEKRITWQDRERLGVNHLGRDIDRHMTWARGSALTRLTDDQAGAPTAQVVATVSREANRVFNEAPKKELNDAAAVVATQAALLGAGFKDLKPGLDVSGLSFGSSAFGLQDANVPARLWGLGTRRIAALAIQQTGVGADSILLIDEVETGLEPHRVRHLVDCLQNPEKKPKVKGQVIFTTHSPSAVIPLPIERLRFVRSKNGETTITEVAPEHQAKMQGYVRSYSHALFARKILVGEGATEEGMCRGLLDTWCAEHDSVHPTHLGFVPLNGGGRTNAPTIAIELKRLGYEVAVLGEAVKLNLADVDLSRRLLLIRQTKFGKTRYVPLAPCTTKQLAAYMTQRRAAGFSLESTAPFFPSALGGRYHVPSFTTVFLQVLRRLGLRGPPGQRGPRIHDLRHSFAVSRLMAWHQSGDNLFAKLPILSTYLGHSTVTGTEVYLHATAELMESVGQRFHEHFAVPSARLLCQPPTSQL